MLTEQEIEQYRKDFVVEIDKINAMTDECLDQDIKAGNCPYPVHLMRGVPIGMFHCPLCGDMCIAGVPHPKKDPEFTDAELCELAQVSSMEVDHKIDFKL